MTSATSATPSSAAEAVVDRSGTTSTTVVGSSSTVDATARPILAAQSALAANSQPGVTGHLTQYVWPGQQILYNELKR